MPGLFGFLYWTLVGGLKIKDNIDNANFEARSKQRAEQNNSPVYYGRRGETYLRSTGERVFWAKDEKLGRFVYKSVRTGEIVCDYLKDDPMAPHNRLKKKLEFENALDRRSIKRAEENGCDYCVLSYHHGKGYVRIYDIKNKRELFLYEKYKDRDSYEYEYYMTWNENGKEQRKDITKDEYRKLTWNWFYIARRED